MKTASVNGQKISKEAVEFELERLVRFYMSHGITKDEIKKSLSSLQEKALEQAIGAKLLLDRAAQVELPVTASDVDAEVQKVVAQLGGEESYRKTLKVQGMSEESFRKELEKGVRVNMLVRQACAHVADPTEEEVTAYYESCKSQFVRPDGTSLTLVDVHDQIKDLLRHEARGRATETFVAELRAAAKIEYERAE